MALHVLLVVLIDAKARQVRERQSQSNSLRFFWTKLTRSKTSSDLLFQSVRMAERSKHRRLGLRVTGDCSSDVFLQLPLADAYLVPDVSFTASILVVVQLFSGISIHLPSKMNTQAHGTSRTPLLLPLPSSCLNDLEAFVFCANSTLVGISLHLTQAGAS